MGFQWSVDVPTQTGSEDLGLHDDDRKYNNNIFSYSLLTVLGGLVSAARLGKAWQSSFSVSGQQLRHANLSKLCFRF